MVLINMKDNMETFGSRVRSLRKRKKMSQKEVAEKLGLSDAVLSNYERNLREPDFETLINLSKLFNVSTDYLLGCTNIPFPSNKLDELFLGDIQNEEIRVWWEKLPSSSIEELKTLKAMWELLQKNLENK